MTFSLKPVENDDGYHVFPPKMTLVKARALLRFEKISVS